MCALCSFSVVLQQVGACIAYVDVIGDVLQPIVAHIDSPTFGGRYVFCMGPGHATLCVTVTVPYGWFLLPCSVFWQIATVCVVIFPLCMLKKMDSLKVSSLVAVFLIFAFAVVVTIDGIYSVRPRMLCGGCRAYVADTCGCVRVVCAVYAGQPLTPAPRDCQCRHQVVP